MNKQPRRINRIHVKCSVSHVKLSDKAVIFSSSLPDCTGLENNK